MRSAPHFSRAAMTGARSRIILTCWVICALERCLICTIPRRTEARTWCSRTPPSAWRDEWVEIYSVNSCRSTRRLTCQSNAYRESSGLLRRRVELVEKSSGESDLAHVNGDEQRLCHRLVIAFVGEDAALGGEYNAVDVAEVEGVVEAGGAAENVHGVVVATQQTARCEARNLFAGMALHVFGESDLEAPPGGTLDVDRRDFFRLESFMGVKERSVEVRPERFAGEVGHVNVVPRSFALLACEGFSRVVAGFDQGSVGGFDRHAFGLEDGALVLAHEVHGDAFLARLRGYDHVLKTVWFTFDVPDGAGDGCGDLDRFNFVPAREPAVCFHCQV